MHGPASTPAIFLHFGNFGGCECLGRKATPDNKHFRKFAATVEMQMPN